MRKSIPRRILATHFWVALAFTGACASSYETHRATGPGHEPSFAILAADTTVVHWQVLNGCDGSSVSGFQPAWTPDEAMIRRIDIMVRMVLDSTVAEFVAYRSTDYLVQYAGVTANGRRLVLANGFHRRILDRIPILPDGVDQQTYLSSWKHVPWVPCDVGRDHFQVIVDTTGAVVDSIRFASR